MSLLKKTIGFMAVLCVVPAAFALTARPSVMGTVASRMPTMTAYINTVGTTTTTSSSLLDNAECIDAYTSCIESADACGPNFEECTTTVLFHAQMPKCLSTLAQCTASGINSLFGTSSTTALGNVKSTNSAGEITDYVYPTSGSVLGQMISGAAIANMYSTSDCVRRYTTCLQRDNVCGADFELCTTNSEFRKQKIFCDSTLARCQSEGKTELFGSTNTSGDPSGTSRIGIMISEGAALAAVNAVSTCYKVVDQCILNACASNPFKCMDGASVQTSKLADAIQTGTTMSSDASTVLTGSDILSNSDVQGYVRSACLDTIGANKYCYATFLGNGAMPTASQLSDMDNQEDVFTEAYAARMNSSMKSKINQLIEDFDSEAKSSCTDTISSCVMRVCGGGSGAACYTQVFGNATQKSINNDAVYDEIKTGCEAIVNTDPYCQYAATNQNDVGSYSYSYINQDVFTTLFPKYSNNYADPIGVIASLNASLSTSYSDAAIAQMRTQCETVAKSCVKSMCGAEYTNCYRNRTDVYSSLTNSGEASFDRSMNRVGGVLDYTVVLGLCLDTVKSADVCQEHLAIEQSKVASNMNNNKTSAWGDASTVRSGWIDAGGASGVTAQTEQVQATDANGNLLCRASDGSQGTCYTTTASGDVYDEPVMISYTTYVQNQAAESLFADVLYDIEKEAQAIYNSKLTKEQNACLAGNAGGIMSASDTGGTFMWAKLRNNRVPSDYSMNGLGRNDFVSSNELYGSFCSVKITLQSDDRYIQEAMKDADWGTAYFAVGDTFTCGSWIPADDLEEISNAVVADETEQMRDSQNRTHFWTTLLGTVGGAVGGAYLGAGIQKGTVFSGLTGFNNPNKPSTKSDSNTNVIDSYINAVRGILENPSAVEVRNNLPGYLTRIRTEATNLGVPTATINSAEKAVEAWADKVLVVNENGAKRPATKKDDVNYISVDKSISTQSAENALDLLEAEVASAVQNGKSSQTWSGLGATLGSVATAVAGGLLVSKATRDIQASSLSAAEKAAYEEWMNSVGKHLHCYIGTMEAGDYGDIISVGLE